MKMKNARIVGKIVQPVAWDNHSSILSSVACNLDQDILLTLLPLFASSEIEGIEWSFDTLYQREKIPDWFYELLHTYAKEHRLVGHGVFFSILSGQWKDEQRKWLDHLSKMSSRFRFDHVTEHFGFTTSTNFHAGAPLSVPLNTTTLAIGRDRLSRIQNAAQCPVGLENLAFAYHEDEVKRQGAFLNQLVEPINGFIILDLHNLYCQSCNFGKDPLDLVISYPLDRVREIHISGGRWEPSRLSENKSIRRDTHDDGVPEEVFTLLKSVIPKCSNLKFVVLEQIGTALKSETQRTLFQKDFLKMKKLINSIERKENALNTFLPLSNEMVDRPLVNQELYDQQLAISNILESSKDLTDAKRKLQMSKLPKTDWQVEKWDDDMLDTAIQIAQTWRAQ